MKLLLDFNLSPKLVDSIVDLFPGSMHGRTAGLHGEARDELIWRYAKQNGFAILSADYDFVELAHQYGYPPKVIRLESMNYPTKFAAGLLRANAVLIADFETSERSVLLLRTK